jgi:hypothetical protein
MHVRRAVEPVFYQNAATHYTMADRRNTLQGVRPSKDWTLIGGDLHIIVCCYVDLRPLN